MEYTNTDIVIGTIIKIATNHTITKIVKDKIFFDKEAIGWRIDETLRRLNTGNWKIISIPQNITSYEIY